MVGGFEKQQIQHINEGLFLIYVVMSPKYRLPTWRLYSKNPRTRNATKHRVTRNDFCYSKWFSQLPLPSWKQRGTNKLAPTFHCVSPWGLFLLLTSGSGRLNFCRYWRSSVGWILCWDDADADAYVADVLMVLLVLTEGLYWYTVSNWHIFQQLSLFIVALCRPFE